MKGLLSFKTIFSQKEVGICLIFYIKIPMTETFTGKILYNVLHKWISWGKHEEETV